MSSTWRQGFPEAVVVVLISRAMELYIAYTLRIGALGASHTYMHTHTQRHLSYFSVMHVGWQNVPPWTFLNNKNPRCRFSCGTFVLIILFYIIYTCIFKRYLNLSTLAICDLNQNIGTEIVASSTFWVLYLFFADKPFGSNENNIHSPNPRRGVLRLFECTPNEVEDHLRRSDGGVLSYQAWTRPGEWEDLQLGYLVTNGKVKVIKMKTHQA